ncbi:MAG TPA: hypothetical protein VNY06_00855, partial [Methylocella sp.]|nr:hypothetical protein [Methylocella sp.]
DLAAEFSLTEIDLPLDYMNGIFCSTALAQLGGKSDIDPQQLVNNLTDDYPRARRNARDALISLGPSAVPRVLVTVFTAIR